MAQGFSQVPGINYFNMCALVAQLASIQTVSAFAAAEDYETWTQELAFKLASKNENCLHL